jgi:hypothetical protein
MSFTPSPMSTPHHQVLTIDTAVEPCFSSLPPEPQNGVPSEGVSRVMFVIPAAHKFGKYGTVTNVDFGRATVTWDNNQTSKHRCDMQDFSSEKARIRLRGAVDIKLITVFPILSRTYPTRARKPPTSKAI